MSESLWEEKLEVVVLIMTGGGNSTRVLNFLLQVIWAHPQHVTWSMLISAKLHDNTILSESTHSSLYYHHWLVLCQQISKPIMGCNADDGAQRTANSFRYGQKGNANRGSRRSPGIFLFQSFFSPLNDYFLLAYVWEWWWWWWAATTTRHRQEQDKWRFNLEMRWVTVSSFLFIYFTYYYCL